MLLMAGEARPCPMQQDETSKARGNEPSGAASPPGQGAVAGRVAEGRRPCPPAIHQAARPPSPHLNTDGVAARLRGGVDRRSGKRQRDFVVISHCDKTRYLGCRNKSLGDFGSQCGKRTGHTQRPCNRARADSDASGIQSRVATASVGTWIRIRIMAEGRANHVFIARSLNIAQSRRRRRHLYYVQSTIGRRCSVAAALAVHIGIGQQRLAPHPKASRVVRGSENGAATNKDNRGANAQLQSITTPRDLECMHGQQLDDSVPQPGFRRWLAAPVLLPRFSTRYGLQPSPANDALLSRTMYVIAAPFPKPVRTPLGQSSMSITLAREDGWRQRMGPDLLVPCGLLPVRGHGKPLQFVLGARGKMCISFAGRRPKPCRSCPACIQERLSVVLGIGMVSRDNGNNAEPAVCSNDGINPLRAVRGAC